MSIRKYKTLVLNGNGEPLHIVPWQDAFQNVMDGVAIMLTEWPEKIQGHNGKTYPRPCVIINKEHHQPKRRRPIPFSKSQLFIRDEFHCCYCGAKLGYDTDNTPECEHVLPKKDGYGKSYSNCVTACRKCNSKKGSKPMESVGMKLLRKPFVPDRIHPAKFLKMMRAEEVPYWIDYIPEAKKYAPLLNISKKMKDAVDDYYQQELN